MPDRVLTRSEDLEKFCRACEDAPYITVDTEFLREKTYFPQLCLIQLGKPKTQKSAEMAIAVDALSEDINLLCLKNIFFNPKITKVFHAARQDLEIMMQLFDGAVPAPLFDTQIAAMVTGYGDQVGYQSLVKKICNIDLDKSHQYTDWSLRPLSKEQVDYALADVIYLRDIYETLKRELDESGRGEWVEEELAHLCDPKTIQQEPETAWEKIKLRIDKPKALVILKELAAWREQEAMTQDRPRHFILRDEVLADLAKLAPKKEEDLEKLRGLPEKYRKGGKADDLLKLIKKAQETPKASWPERSHKRVFPQDMIPALEMAKMLLKIQASDHGIVPRLVASNDDLETFLLQPKNPSKITEGWRNDIFGQYVQSLLEGRLALRLDRKKVVHQSVV